MTICESTLGRGFGEADYFLFADDGSVDDIEANKECTAFIGIDIGAEKYSDGIPKALLPQRLFGSGAAILDTLRSGGPAAGT